MKATYDNTEIDIPEEMMSLFRNYAIFIMDAMRKSEPELAYCWNVCKIEFDGLEPCFSYGRDTSDFATDGEQFGYYVLHPNFISESKSISKKSKKKK